MAEKIALIPSNDRTPINVISRPIFTATSTPYVDKIVYHQKASPAYKSLLVVVGILSCNCGLCIKAEELVDETYVTVYENKIEYNYPIALPCCCKYDQHGLLYLDRAIGSKAGKAECCSPPGTHMSCFPTCCDACGEGLVLYGATCCSKEGVILPHEAACCCRAWTMFPGLQNATELANTILMQRDVALAKAAAPKQMHM